MILCWKDFPISKTQVQQYCRDSGEELLDDEKSSGLQFPSVNATAILLWNYTDRNVGNLIHVVPPLSFPNSNIC